jgi:hypothetical protein
MRMNKEELLKLLETLKINKEEFWILSSSALVLRDLFPDAGDLDIAVTDKGLEELKQNYNLKQKENGWYIVTDKIECVCDGAKEKLKYQPELVEGYYVQNLQEYYEYLISSNREKDKLRINIVKEELNKN